MSHGINSIYGDIFVMMPVETASTSLDYFDYYSVQNVTALLVSLVCRCPGCFRLSQHLYQSQSSNGEG